MKERVFLQIERPDPALIERIRAIGVSTVYEAMGVTLGYRCLMDAGLRPVIAGERIAGPAITANCHAGDNGMSHVAVVLSQPGDVLVISGGDPVSALWGDMAGMAAKLRGVVGVILDGGVRDVADIREMGLPTWARTVSPAKPVKATPGSANVPIRAGGTMVEPGDVILADDDGVLVIPAADLEWILERAEARAASEVEARKVMEAGDTETLYKKNKMDQILADAGVETIDDSYQNWKASQK